MSYVLHESEGAGAVGRNDEMRVTDKSVHTGTLYLVKFS